MADIRTDPAQYGDSPDTLWLKIATAFQAWAVVADTGDVKTAAPLIGDTPGNILKAAYAAQQI